MRCLSIRQPWAWAILNAGKRIENRAWRSCHYRGPLLIHAAKGCTRQEYEDARAMMVHHRLVLASPGALGPAHRPVLPPLEKLDRGGIVGVCKLVNAVHVSLSDHRLVGGRCIGCGWAQPSPEAMAADPNPRIPMCSAKDPWAFGPIGLVLDDVRPLPFVPWTGSLGFFDVPDHMIPALGTGPSVAS